MDVEVMTVLGADSFKMFLHN